MSWAYLCKAAHLPFILLATGALADTNGVVLGRAEVSNRFTPQGVVQVVTVASQTVARSLLVTRGWCLNP